MSPEPEPAPESDEVPAPGEALGIVEDLDVPLEVKVAYDEFRYAFGGSWAERLVVYAFPACYATTPELPECGEGVPLPVVNDQGEGTLTFSTGDLPVAVAQVEADSVVDDAAVAAESAEVTPGEPIEPAPGHDAEEASYDAPRPLDGDLQVVSAVGSVRDERTGVVSDTVAVAATSAAAPSTGGVIYSVQTDNGNFGASPLSPAGSWQVGEGSGEFSYTYPFDLPDAIGGPTPSLGLGYSSGTVDGMSLAENGQASNAGLGWDLTTGYISRSFAACADDGHPTKGDLCWKNVDGEEFERFTITLNGRSDRLIQIPGTQSFRLQDDPGWRVTRFRGDPPAADEPDNSDNNNEGWSVETPDGVTYWFGWGRGSNSVWTVPVYGNDPGEPCRDAASEAGSWCQQAWRWSLDRVIDANNNKTRYFYETEQNHYARWGNTSNRTPYDRAGRLTSIEYSYKAADETPATWVDVNSVLRCKEKMTDLTADCLGAEDGPRAAPGSWPDTPGDLICDSNDTCNDFSPSFFSTQRYSSIVTKVRLNGAEKTLDRWTLNHTMPDPDKVTGGTNGPEQPDLWLDTIQRTGELGGELNQTNINFNALDAPLRNRVVATGNERKLLKYRIREVRNELGGLTQVSYGHATDKACDATYVASRARWNSDRECFAQKYAPPGGTPKWEWFHKYVVTQIALGDRAMGYETGAQPSTANPGGLRKYVYTYLGTPAWRHVGDKNVPNDDETWSDWRGYGRARVYTARTDGTDSDTAFSVRHVARFRGMDGSASNTSGGVVSAAIETFHNTGAEPADEAWLQGRVAEEYVATSTGTFIESRNYRTYTPIVTATNPDTPDARMILEPSLVEYKKSTAGWVSRTVSRTYNTTGAANSRGVLVGTVEQVSDTGYSIGAGATKDQTCEITAWRGNSAAGTWIRAPRTVTRYAETCAAKTPATMTSWVDTHYDKSETNAALPLTAGLPTRIDTGATSAETAGALKQSIVYDTWGRVTKTIDAKNESTTYAYTAATASVPDKIVTTGPTGLASTSNLTARGTASSVIDANGQTVSLAYDPLGRLTSVTEPTQTGAASQVSTVYAYTTAANTVTRVTTGSLLANGITRTHRYDYYDGWGRHIQTQVPQVNSTTAAPGRVVTLTHYDDRGLKSYELAGFTFTGAAGTNAVGAGDFGLITPEPSTVAPRKAWAYDTFGRMTNDSQTTETGASTTLLSYDGAATTTDAPAPLGKTLTYTDAQGRTARVSQTTDAGVPQHSTDLVYQGTSLVSQSSNINGIARTWGYTYDLAGRRLTSSDPDVGSTTYTYDANSNLTQSVAQGRDPVTTTYDKLNRPPERQVNGAAVAKWTYGEGLPAANLAKGQLVKTESITGLGTYTVETPEFTRRGLPKKVTHTYPMGTTTPRPTYTETMAYDDADNLTALAMPAIGGLTATTLNYTYDTTKQGSPDLDRHPIHGSTRHQRHPGRLHL